MKMIMLIALILLVCGEEKKQVELNKKL